ncbi:MAG: hypothetical protein IJT47_00610 [Selenomonadaceae bacterium]|nr:hypothetical protein [Selenomonadaceae bacterium]
MTVTARSFQFGRQIKFRNRKLNLHKATDGAVAQWRLSLEATEQAQVDLDLAQAQAQSMQRQIQTPRCHELIIKIFSPLSRRVKFLP